MNNISDLVKKKDGAGLKALVEQGDHEAAIAFAGLVFDGIYAGDTSAGGTKKDAKDLARSDAFEFVEKAAADQHFDAMVLWADVNFSGVREPGQFGSNLRGAYYGEAETCYQNLLDHPDCPEDRRSEFLTRKAQAIEFKSRIKGIDRNAEIDEILNEAVTGDHPSALAHFILSGRRWKQKSYESAVEHASQACQDFPYAHLTLRDAFRDGLGVAADEGKANEHHKAWEEGTAPKKRGKK